MDGFISLGEKIEEMETPDLDNHIHIFRDVLNIVEKHTNTIAIVERYIISILGRDNYEKRNAEFGLGNLYAEGRPNISKSFIIAYMFFGVSAKSGHESAEKERDLIGLEMPQQHKELAKSFVNEWIEFSNKK
ncbi:MAG: hypothetical protein ACNYPD_01340 [Candidatus Halichondribacter symbioticus]